MWPAVEPTQCRCSFEERASRSRVDARLLGTSSERLSARDRPMDGSRIRNRSSSHALATPVPCQAAVLAAVRLLPGEAGGGTPCGCLHHNRRPRGRPCAIALVEHREDAVSLGARSATRSPWVGMQFGSAMGFNAKPQARDTGRSSGDRLGRTVRLVLRRRAAVARASVSAPLLPLFLAVPGLDGHLIARPAPASTEHHRTPGTMPAWSSVTPPHLRASPLVTAYPPGNHCGAPASLMRVC